MFHSCEAQPQRIISDFGLERRGMEILLPVQTTKNGAQAKSAYAPKFHNPRLTDVAVDSFGDLVFRHSADDLLDDLAILEDQQGRDAANLIATGGVHRLVHVQLGHFELASVVASDLRHRW